MEKESASCGGRVDLIGQELEMHTAKFQVTNNVN